MSSITNDFATISAQDAESRARSSTPTKTQPVAAEVDDLEKIFSASQNPLEMTLRAFFSQNEPIELRFRTREGVVGSGVYTDHQKFLKDASALSDDPGTEAVWCNLNEIRTGLASNRHRRGAHAVKDSDISRRKRILIDVEAEKPKEFKHDSATDEEKCKAEIEAIKISAVLDAFGIPYIFADSGNGFHLNISVDLPCNDESDSLVRKFLESLQRHVPTAKIDMSVHNRSRVTKLYGTQTRKGRKLTDRPWRVSALLKEADREVVPADQLQRVIDAAPSAAGEAKAQQYAPGGQEVVPGFDIEDFFHHFGIRARQRESIYATDVCIMAGREHSGHPDKTGFFFDGRHLGWKCFSDDCAKYTIKDVIKKLHEAHTPYPKRIWPEKQRSRPVCAISELPLVDEQVDDQEVARQPLWPSESLEGDYIAEYAHRLTDGTQIPPQFVREQVKMLLGMLHEGRIGFPGQCNLGTRHYVHLVTEGPQGCKDESWKRVISAAGPDGVPSPWKAALEKRGVQVLDGSVFGSGQYMAKELEERPRCIAVFGEGREVWEKNAHQGATLETALLKLYDGTSHWTGSLTNKRHGSDDIHLSLTSFFTLDSYFSSFSAKGSGGGGYLSRNVIAYSHRLPYCGTWPDRDYEREQQAVEKILGLAPTEDDFFLAPTRIWVPDFDADARERFEAFIREIESSDHSYREYISRIVDLAKRDLLIRARYSGSSRITLELTERAIAWGRHQLSLRAVLWPCDRGSQVEAMTHAILRTLKKHPRGLSERRLRDFCHVDRLGSGGQEVFNRAKHALLIGKRIVMIGRTRKNTIVWGIASD